MPRRGLDGEWHDVCVRERDGRIPDGVGQDDRSRKDAFKYWKYLVECEGYQVNPTSWAAGETRGHQGVPKATHCDPWPAGGTFTKSDTTAWEFSSGVSISGNIGINLSARTGYDSHASVHYHFGHRTYRCGKKDDPGGSPGLLVAGLPSH